MVDINSDKELFIAHTQERMKNVVGESGNQTHDLQISTPMVYRCDPTKKGVVKFCDSLDPQLP